MNPSVHNSWFCKPCRSRWALNLSISVTIIPGCLNPDDQAHVNQKLIDQRLPKAMISYLLPSRPPFFLFRSSSFRLSCTTDDGSAFADRGATPTPKLWPSVSPTVPSSVIGNPVYNRYVDVSDLTHYYELLFELFKIEGKTREIVSKTQRCPHWMLVKQSVAVSTRCSWVWRTDRRMDGRSNESLLCDISFDLLCHINAHVSHNPHIDGIRACTDTRTDRCKT